MMYDPQYVLDFENMALADDGDVLMEPEAAEVTTVDDEPSSTLEQARREWRAQSQQQPGDEPRRAGPSDITNDKGKPSSTRSSKVPPSSEVVTVDPPKELLEPPTVDTFKEWTKAMITDASGDRVDLPELKSTFKSTYGLLINAKQAISELFGTKAFKASVCRSPERSDLKISQEETLGWVLAYARGRKLLTEEARKIGKLAGTFAGDAKKELDGIRDTAKKRRSRARQKGASAEELEAIDTQVAEERAAITKADCEIKHMPAANTVIVERHTPQLDPSECRRRALAVMFGSREAWEAIDAAQDVEDAERQLFYEADCDDNPIDHDETREKIDVALVHYKHTLARLKSAFPQEINDCSAEGVCEHRRPCPCGRGFRGAWPWVVQTAKRGFCVHSKNEAGAWNDGEYSCEEIHRERQWWLHAYAWDPREDERHRRLGRMADAKRVQAQIAAKRRDLY